MKQHYRYMFDEAMTLYDDIKLKNVDCTLYLPFNADE